MAFHASKLTNIQLFEPIFKYIEDRFNSFEDRFNSFKDRSNSLELNIGANELNLGSDGTSEDFHNRLSEIIESE